MTCTHSTPERWEWQDVEVSPYGDTERQLVQVDGQPTYEDIDIGRFRCTQCGHIGYYTGQWRRYFEEGAPCPGSEGVPRGVPTGKRG